MGMQGIGQGFCTRLAALALGMCLMTGPAAAAAARPAAEGPAPAALSLADPIPLEMMHWTGSYAYLEGELQGASFQAVRMPYGTGRRSMLIVLPDANVSFGPFVAAITPQALNRWSGQLRSSFGSVSLPKLEVPDGLSRTPLASLGAPAAAGFGLDRVLASRRFNMNVDRPFFYAVEDDKTHELLFVGVLMDPT